MGPKQHLNMGTKTTPKYGTKTALNMRPKQHLNMRTKTTPKYEAKTAPKYGDQNNT